MAGVPIHTIVGYPQELTDADWQKKKGVIGKMTPTGVGEELKKAQRLHSAVSSDQLDPNARSPKTEKDVEEAIAKATQHYKATVEPLRKQLMEVASVADKAAATLKKKTGGASAAKAAEAVSKAASNFAVTCKSLDLESAAKEARQRIAKREELASNLLAESLKKFLVGSKAFLADPTAASWDKNVKQQGRSVSNSISVLVAYRKAFWSEFEKFKGFDLGTLKLMEDSEEAKASRVVLCKSAMGQVVQIARFKP